jgi:hypothetical protein
MHFQCQNRRFRVFEEDYWKDFQKYSVITKEQAKTLSLIFPSKNKQEIVKKTISVSTESTYLLLEAVRKIFIS